MRGCEEERGLRPGHGYTFTIISGSALPAPHRAYEPGSPQRRPACFFQVVAYGQGSYFVPDRVRLLG